MIPVVDQAIFADISLENRFERHRRIERCLTVCEPNIELDPQVHSLDTRSFPEWSTSPAGTPELLDVQSLALRTARPGSYPIHWGSSLGSPLCRSRIVLSNRQEVLVRKQAWMLGIEAWVSPSST